jgi:hypothetical protein
MKLPSLKFRVSSGKVGDHPLEALRNSLEHRLLLKWLRYRSLCSNFLLFDFLFYFHLLVRNILINACLLISLVVSFLQVDTLSIYLELYHEVGFIIFFVGKVHIEIILAFLIFFVVYLGMDLLH